MQWQIGDVRVTRVVEQQAAMPPEGLIRDVDPGRMAAHARWLAPDFMQDDGQIVLSIHALIVESRGRSIVVDTCMGNDRPLPMDMGVLQTRFLEDLEAVVPRTGVDTVVCTHLHFDHVGWNTMWDGERFVPTFPNARYLFGREEYEHWRRAADDDENVDLGAAVDPVVAARLHELVEHDHALTDEVRLEPTPGHTPGHVSVRIESRGEQAVITGDLVHHPVQLAEPEWGSHPDVDPERAVRTRRAFVEACADRPVLVIGTHFAGPTAGHLVRGADGIRFAGRPGADEA